jgi:hypothetical protein
LQPDFYFCHKPIKSFRDDVTAHVAARIDLTAFLINRTLQLYLHLSKFVRLFECCVAAAAAAAVVDDHSPQQKKITKDINLLFIPFVAIF